MLGATRAQYCLRQTFVYFDMYLINRPEVMILYAQDKFDAQGSNLADEKAKELIRELVVALAAHAARARYRSHRPDYLFTT